MSKEEGTKAKKKNSLSTVNEYTVETFINVI